MKAIVLALCALTATAAADGKTKELATGYQKELTACRTRADGVAKVQTGAKSLGDEYANDLEQLTKGLATIQAYCGELDATLQLIADPAASYKALEKQLDEHDNKIRALRKQSKQTLDALAPILGKLIPAINARAGTAAPVVKKTPLAFPSGRKVDAPALAGAWKVSGSPATDTAEYTEAKATSTLTVKLVTGTCADRKKDLPRAAVDNDPNPKLDWYVRYDKDARRIRAGCRSFTGGSLIATLDDPIAASWPTLEPVLLAMLAARDPK
jgi:ABC-type transporter Mla subunit MlaD